MISKKVALNNNSYKVAPTSNSLTYRYTPPLLYLTTMKPHIQPQKLSKKFYPLNRTFSNSKISHYILHHNNTNNYGYLRYKRYKF